MSSRNLSVLLVEDSRVLAERLRETLLSVPGVQLAGTVDSEADAVAALQRHPVDVLLLDLHLRQGTGFGVLRAIPSDQAKKIVVIVLTNYDLAEYRRAAAALGARYFLDKLRDFDRLPLLLQQIGADGSDPGPVGAPGADAAGSGATAPGGPRSH
ncbi:MAG TPA: response regulator [Steroidobacteraceae bacterium]|jgi:DNA-binding NarL/FixJ family response regulator|nr:response regulator [Steroidobacteraceae bacterium]